MNPRRRQWLGFGLGLGLGLGRGVGVGLGLGLTAGSSLAAVARERLQWRERLLQGFGATLWLRAAHADAGRVEQALDRAAAVIRRIESQMSLFDADSALSRLNRSGRLLAPDPGLRQVLQVARQVAAASGGAFDATMQPLWTTWETASREGRLPTQRELTRACGRVDWRAPECLADRILLPTGFALSLNGIAQGHAADEVRAALQALGIRHAMFDTGETAVLGQGPDALPWRFGIEDAVRRRESAPAAAAATAAAATLAPWPPASSPAVVVPDGHAVATSSDRHTAFSADGRHHHIVDPRSGWSPPHWSSVTIVARRAVLADALTKVFFMLPPSRLQSEAARWRVRVVAQDRSGRWVDTAASPAGAA
jgi:thiamine biosynthesis lipoprotein